MTGRSRDWRLPVRLIFACFPRSWRDDGRAAEALGIAWDAADDEGRELLGAKQALDLSWLGLRARTSALSLSLPLTTRRLVATLALGGGVALSVCLLFLAGFPPSPDSSMSPLASAGTVVYVAWILSGLLVVAARETVARCCLLGTAVLTAAIAAFAGVAGLRRPALFLLATLLILNVLAVGVRPLTRRPTHTRLAVTVVAIAIGLAVAAYSRVELDWPTTASVYYGNVLMLSTVADIALLALAAAALIAVGSTAGRRQVLPGLLISAGPWALLAARGSSQSGPAAHAHIVAALIAWAIAAACALAVSRQRKAAERA